MAGKNGLCIAVVGIRFGAEFVPIYASHPDVGEVVICDTDPERLSRVGDEHRIERRFTSTDAMLAAPGIDAVHLLTPLYTHVDLTLRVLASRKHCACAVTMGTTLADLRRVVEAQRDSGRNYMMMETMIYGREYLYIKDLYDRGEMGELTFLRGIYFQDLVGYPDYWRGVPPMHYATHAIAPLLALAGTVATRVSCLGSGRLSEQIKLTDDSPFRLQTAIFTLAGTDAAAEVTRSWFETARPYVEGFNVYGTKRGFEWSSTWGEHPLTFTMIDDRTGPGTPVDSERVRPPDFAERLPEPLRRFTAYEHDGAHGGSHPHLAHEFIRSIVEGRPPAIDAATAANWTAPGICAHESSMRGGEWVDVPRC